MPFRRLAAPLLVLGLLICSGGAALAQGSPAVPPPPTAPDYRFGIAEANANPVLAAKAGVAWTRIAFFWPQMEPTSGQFTLESQGNDAPLQALANHGIALAGVIQGVPTWAEATPPPRPGVSTAPVGLTLAWNDPGNTWGQFMYWLARHYAGLINTWIIGNEIGINHGPHQNWGGTVAQYAQMIMVADQAVHAANPEAHVLAPAAPYWYTRGRTTQALLQSLGQLPGAEFNHDYIDGLDVNLYSPIQANAMVYSTYESALQAAGLTLPIWLTEANTLPATPSTPSGATPFQQASYLVEDLASSFQWVTRAEIYKLQSRPGGSDLYGLANAQGQPSPSLQAYTVFTHIMQGATWMSSDVAPAVPGQAAPSTPAIVTWGAPGRLIQMVWDQGTGPASVTLPAVAASATVITILGHSYVVQPVNGSFQIALNGARVRAGQSGVTPIGGEPYYVIQHVPLGADNTPTTWNEVAMNGFPVVPTGQWQKSSTVVMPPGPVSAIVNPSGDQLVIRTNGRLFWRQIAGTGARDLNDPIAAAVGPNHWVYVANAGNNDVLAYRPNGQQAFTFGGYGTAAGDLEGEGGIAVGPSGTVYVTNPGSNMVNAYTPQGKFFAEWGGYGSQAGQFNGLGGIVVNASGTVLVADTLNNRIQEFTPTGQYVASLATPDPSELQWGPGGKLLVQNGVTGNWTTLKP
jgi:hypothetical protein